MRSEPTHLRVIDKCGSEQIGLLLRQVNSVTPGCDQMTARAPASECADSGRWLGRASGFVNPYVVNADIARRIKLVCLQRPCLLL